MLLTEFRTNISALTMALKTLKPTQSSLNSSSNRVDFLVQIKMNDVTTSGSTAEIRVGITENNSDQVCALVALTKSAETRRV